MQSRYAAIWFRYLLADQRAVRAPELKDTAFVLAAPSRGRMVITASSIEAERKGILPGMVLADARAIFPDLKVLEDKPDLAEKLLGSIGQWALRYTPFVAVDLPDGLMLDITGCAHLWSGEKPYLMDINQRLKTLGYHVRCAIADTPAAAWANSRYGRVKAIIEPGGQADALAGLPPAALRLDVPVICPGQCSDAGLVRSCCFAWTRHWAMRQSCLQRLSLLSPVKKACLAWKRYGLHPP
jgi:protein ImuB